TRAPRCTRSATAARGTILRFSRALHNVRPLPLPFGGRLRLTGRSGACRSPDEEVEESMTTVRAAITQTTWTGDKASMLDRHEAFMREAAEQGAQVICFQELFYGPYFGITQDKKYYDYAEPA